MQKVPRRKQFPYAEKDYEMPEATPQVMAEEDYETLKKLVRSGGEKKFKDFINKRLIKNENISSTPGLATRDYLNAITGESVKARYPEIREAALEGTPADLGKAVRARMFPKIEKALKSYNLSTDIQSSENEDTTNLETGLMKLAGRETPSGNIGTAIHENAHLLDALAKKYSKDKYIYKAQNRQISPEREQAIQEFIKSKPAAYSSFKENPNEEEKFFKGTTLTESKNKYGRIIENPEIPNFGDYDFEKGEFRSDMIRDPLDVQEESGRPHHLDRNQTYENMIKALEDEGKLDRVTKSDIFKKLRTKLA